MKNSKVLACWILVLLHVLLQMPSPAAAQRQQRIVHNHMPRVHGEAPEGADSVIEILLNERVRLSDGVELTTRIWLPADRSKPVPVVYLFSSYVFDDEQANGMYFARRGFAYVAVMTRGRGQSTGVFRPFIHDSADSAEVVEWIKKRDFCNGQVMMRGGSYNGFSQWSTLKSAPDGLVTAIPNGSVMPGYDFPIYRNMLYSYEVEWLGVVHGTLASNNLWYDIFYWMGRFKELYLQHDAFATLAQRTSVSERIFAEWVAHPTYDEYWTSTIPQGSEYARISIPMLTVTGYYDWDQVGALRYYRNFQRFAPAENTRKNFMLIGPWEHVESSNIVGGATFGDKANVQMNDLERQWFEWIAGTGDRPELLKDRISYFVMGTNSWRYASSLEEFDKQHQTLYLSSPNNPARDVFDSGSLSEQPMARDEPDFFVYDPLDVSAAKNYIVQGSIISRFLYLTNNFVINQRSAFQPHKLIYHTPPYSEATVVAGWPKLHAYISLDVPDTDLMAELYEIQDDGGSLFLGFSAIRARYRNSLTRAELLEPGKVELYSFELPFTARRIAPGSRLRLILTAINLPDWEKNYNSGGAVAFETGDDARTATITLHHDKSHPSALVLPLQQDMISAVATPKSAGR